MENKNLRVTQLSCEYTSNPLGIDILKPLFSWSIHHSERNQKQSGYQIVVASSLENAKKTFGDMWDSREVNTDQTTVKYQGKLLESKKTYYWKVRVWDKDRNISPYSEISSFEMGLLNPEDWQGFWVGKPGGGSPLFRKEFKIDKEIKRSRVYVSGLGYYELRLNGEKVGDRVLDPGWTDYDEVVLYSTYDVTSLLRKGSNAVGVMLGNGRFCPPDEVVNKNPYKLKKYQSYPIFILEIYIEFEDDSFVNIVSDSNWKTKEGPIIFNDIYDGEIYDARLEEEGWDEAFFDDSGWEFAQEIGSPQGKLKSQATFPCIKVDKILLPKELTSPGPGVYIYDFGQNFSGWARLKVSGPGSTQVKLRFSELLNEDGSLNTNPNQGAGATDIYILKGQGEENYEPRFTYHGFRYVEVRGFPGIPSLETLEGCFVHSEVRSTGSFFTSCSLVNKIHENIRWGQLSNLMSIPTDCPQRDERMGWMGDAQLVSEETIYNFQMIGFFKKWLTDIKKSQKEDGSVPDLVPPYWDFYPADPAWGTACVSIPWDLYLYYGDREILEENYSMMRRWVEFLHSQSKDGILELGKYGDWCPPWHIISVETPISLVSTWFYYRDTLLFSQIAKILGKIEDQDRFLKRAEEIKISFNKKFLNDKNFYGWTEDWYRTFLPSTASIEDKEITLKRLHRYLRSQTANILALYSELVPVDKRKTVWRELIDDIVVVHGNHLNTGIIGTKYILDVLAENGEADLAFKLVTQATYPSWGYMMKEGATTLWERWESLAEEGMNSQNHIMLGTVDAWFYKYLVGIQVDPHFPGWRKIIIKPYPVKDLYFASASLETFRGLISSAWWQGVNSFLLQVSIPVNSQAEIRLPKMGLKNIVIEEGGDNIWQKGTLVYQKEGIGSVKENQDRIIIQIGSGDYQFKLKEE
jgi:alpha-L-rhamnosidase